MGEYNNEISRINTEMEEFDSHWAKTDRADSRRDRHSLLSTFSYEGEHFVSEANTESEIINIDYAHRLLSVLNTNQRRIVLGKTIAGYSFTDLGKILGKDESSVRKMYRRAIKIMRDYAGKLN
ncbi:sigma-70 family RNA polymerase sigma factor [Alloscardovia theropitheci]|uniref:Sigma-70 family RNA polymerase sigma factor n=1 Tax=Alloscardovia theropitheci TaxID=2496842 RepID=A0A4R0QZ83_9BIFI|nr:sigma factor-like helix-turn-helix DNA-binding protein [Alloscardovia theropitheci]TCD53896.1 sigma-70 family RNA polymerase sigma factor [Alloscardovia theropitheci]